MHTITEILKFGLLIGATALLATSTQAQQVYKWKDDKGALHYTQTPPPARYAQSVNIKERPTPAPAANATKTPPADKDNSANTAGKSPVPAGKPAPRLSAETCKTMQDNLALLQTGRRLYEKDAGGERSYITEERRAQQIQTYQQNINNGCK